MVIQALIYEGVIEVEFLYGEVKEVGRDRDQFRIGPINVSCQQKQPAPENG